MRQEGIRSDFHKYGDDRGSDCDDLDSDGEFEKVASELAVGEISTVVQTGAGFHLLQLDARRTRNMSARIKRSHARQQVRTRKVNEKYEEWLGEIRDIAYIEYRVAQDDL